MRGLLAGAGLHNPPVARAPKPGPVPNAAPKLPMQTPKLNAVSVTHHYSAGKPPRTFRFRKPTDLATHIKKIQNNEWAHPNVQQSAGKVDRAMDIG
jgi:hypothetical protein